MKRVGSLVWDPAFERVGTAKEFSPLAEAVLVEFEGDGEETWSMNLWRPFSAVEVLVP